MTRHMPSASYYRDVDTDLYVCTGCGQEFTRKDSVIKHLKILKASATSSFLGDTGY